MWYIVMQYLVSFLDLQSSRLGRDCFTLIVFLLPCGFKSYTFLPRGAMGCSVICDCSISRPYPLTFWQKMLALKTPITKSRLLFSSAKMFQKHMWQTEWTQIRLLLCSGSTLFARYVGQLFAADDFFICIFIGALRVKLLTEFTSVNVIRQCRIQYCM